MLHTIVLLVNNKCTDKSISNELQTALRKCVKNNNNNKILIKISAKRKEKKRKAFLDGSSFYFVALTLAQQKSMATTNE